MVVKTWSLTLREKQKLEVFVNKVLRKYLGLRAMKLSESRESYIMLNYMHCILHLTIRNF